MSSRLGTMLALAALTLSAAAAGADEAKPAPPHIAAVQTFLVAWGHERWDDLRGVAADSVTVQVADRSATVEPGARSAGARVVLPFRGLSTVRDGAGITGVTVDSLAVRIGDQETRGAATVTLKEEGGQFRVVAVSVNGAR